MSLVHPVVPSADETMRDSVSIIVLYTEVDEHYFVVFCLTGSLTARGASSLSSVIRPGHPDRVRPIFVM